MTRPARTRSAEGQSSARRRPWGRPVLGTQVWHGETAPTWKCGRPRAPEPPSRRRLGRGWGSTSAGRAEGACHRLRHVTKRTASARCPLGTAQPKVALRAPAARPVTTTAAAAGQGVPAPGHFNRPLRTLGAHSGAAHCPAPGAAGAPAATAMASWPPLVQRVVKLVCERLVLLLVHLGHGCDHPLHGRPVGRAEQRVSREGQGSGLRPRPGWDRAGPGRRPLQPLADSQPTSDTGRSSGPTVA